MNEHTEAPKQSKSREQISTQIKRIGNKLATRALKQDLEHKSFLKGTRPTYREASFDIPAPESNEKKLSISDHSDRFERRDFVSVKERSISDDTYEEVHHGISHQDGVTTLEQVTKIEDDSGNEAGNVISISSNGFAKTWDTDQQGPLQPKALSDEQTVTEAANILASVRDGLALTELQQRAKSDQLENTDRR